MEFDDEAFGMIPVLAEGWIIVDFKIISRV